VHVVLGLGSNLGDRLGTLRNAVGRLREVATVERVSSVYESAAVGPPQPDYLNAALLARFEGTAHALLDATQAVERDLGRVRTIRWGPRTIDIDVLWIEGMVVHDERLVVPHPELWARAFALCPLLELVPDATDPVTGERYIIEPEARLAPFAHPGWERTGRAV
jgi:2-amino-4-hydroxy-6-hydroxymethyldihydropteridine diphosphokinase